MDIIKKIIYKKNELTNIEYPDEYLVCINAQNRENFDEFRSLGKAFDFESMDFISIRDAIEIENTVLSLKATEWNETIIDLISTKLKVDDNKNINVVVKDDLCDNLQNIYRAIEYARSRVFQRCNPVEKLTKVNKKEIINTFNKIEGSSFMFDKSSSSSSEFSFSASENSIIKNLTVDTGSYGGYFCVYIDAKEIGFCEFSMLFGGVNRIHYFSDQEKLDKLYSILHIATILNSESGIARIAGSNQLI